MEAAERVSTGRPRVTARPPAGCAARAGREKKSGPEWTCVGGDGLGGMTCHILRGVQQAMLSHPRHPYVRGGASAINHTTAFSTYLCDTLKSKPRRHMGGAAACNSPRWHDATTRRQIISAEIRKRACVHGKCSTARRPMSACDVHSHFQASTVPHAPPRHSFVCSVVGGLFERVREEERSDVGVHLVEEDEAAHLAEDTPRRARPQRRDATLLGDPADARRKSARTHVSAVTSTRFLDAREPRAYLLTVCE